MNTYMYLRYRLVLLCVMLVFLDSSFIFRNHFVPVRVIVNPEQVLGMLGMRWDYALDGRFHFGAI